MLCINGRKFNISGKELKYAFAYASYAGDEVDLGDTLIFNSPQDYIYERCYTRQVVADSAKREIENWHMNGKFEREETEFVEKQIEPCTIGSFRKAYIMFYMYAIRLILKALEKGLILVNYRLYGEAYTEITSEQNLAVILPVVSYIRVTNKYSSYCYWN